MLPTDPAASSRRLTGVFRLLALLALLAIPPLLGDTFQVRFAAEILVVGTAAMSLGLLVGFGGLVSLGHAAVFGAAAYTAAVVSGHIGAELLPMLAIGIGTGAVVAGAMALLAARSSGLFFLVLTLVSGQMIWEVVFRWRAVTGGADGLRGFPTLTLAGQPLDTAVTLYLAAAVVALVALALARAFIDAPAGRALVGSREQPLRMGALGYGVGRIRLQAFLLAGAMAGAAGALYPFVNQYVGPDTVHWSLSATLIVMLVIGGVGSLYGGYVGAAVYLGIQTYLSSYTDRWQLLVGLVFVATVILMPHGIARAVGDGVRRLRGARAESPALPPPSHAAGRSDAADHEQRGGVITQAPAAAPSDTLPPSRARAASDTSTPALAITDITKQFGALRVLEGISLSVQPGETLGLIGPNGAGKTTLFNIMTGFLAPDTGHVACLGHDLAGLAPSARVQQGLVRTFQKSMVFPALSVRENVALAIRARLGTGYRLWRPATARREADAQATQLIDAGPLAGRGSAPVQSLSYGEQRIVDVLIALALAPRVLLLDEPTAGLASGEAQQLLDMIRHHDASMAVILIAHDLDVVFQRCDRIAVLDLGRLVAVDTPEAIRRHPEVRAAYLGLAAGDESLLAASTHTGAAPLAAETMP